MGALDAVEWEACLLEPIRNAEAERMLRREVGMVSPGARYFLDSPWVTRAGARLDVGHLPTLHVPGELAGMIALVVSQENACRYCYEATRMVMKILGFEDARIRRLEENALAGDPTSAEQAALQFARCVTRASPLATCQEGRPLLEAGYSPEAVKELAALAATNVFFNRLSTAPALPPQDWAFGERWYMRLLRPLAARIVRPRRASAPVFLKPDERRGPFAPIVNALDGLPIAPRLRAVLDDAWQTAVLPQRTKALVFAVVGRGIRCPISENEAVRLLTDCGMSAAEIEAALAHLGPGLDERERAALSLARESLWYRPASLQRHARAIRALFSRQEFVELIGLAALANMLCRLGVAVEVDRATS
jgi:alkylhydroperoxidase family enzyme